MPRPSRPTLSALLAAVALSVSLAACGGEESTTSTTSTTSTSTSAAGGDGGRSCEEVPAAEPKDVKLKPSKQQVNPGEEITATVSTNCGDFEIALDPEAAPKTVSWFVQMVKQGIYDRTPFNRVVPNFLIQGGDLGADNGYLLAEKPPVDTEYTRGTVAMAKTAAEPPGASGTQFFIVTAADAGLPADYAVLGEVADGRSTIEAISAQADPALGPEGGQPVTPVVIESITLS
jgi:cyclophilin family peptidyl-prolyl cis-trans isomerase